MFVKFHARHGDCLICRDVFNGVIIYFSVFTSRKQYSVCIHFHIVRVVVVGCSYRKAVITAVIYCCSVVRRYCITLTALGRRNIKRIYIKSCINSQIFVEHGCFVNLNSACFFGIPACKTVSCLYGRCRKRNGCRASLNGRLRIIKSAFKIKVCRINFSRLCRGNK